jgi:hypothetical protein
MCKGGGAKLSEKLPCASAAIDHLDWRLPLHGRALFATAEPEAPAGHAHDTCAAAAAVARQGSLAHAFLPPFPLQPYDTCAASAAVSRSPRQGSSAHAGLPPFPLHLFRHLELDTGQEDAERRMIRSRDVSAPLSAQGKDLLPLEHLLPLSGAIGATQGARAALERIKRTPEPGASSLTPRQQAHLLKSHPIVAEEREYPRALISGS